ncbi:MAG: hypothetical protein HY900_25220 [Deltaproteobacteria bacterium]|nr:hypothetical protein [Deltaproteobacteria bacterium]
MKSRTTAGFRRTFALLPDAVRGQARKAYALFRSNPQHAGLRLKLVHSSRPIYSVRIGIHYRALGVLADDELVWFWVGARDDYERLISQR